MLSKNHSRESLQYTAPPAALFPYLFITLLLVTSCDLGGSDKSTTSKPSSSLNVIVAPNEGAEFKMMTLSRDGKTVFVADAANNRVIQINEDTLEIEKQFNVQTGLVSVTQHKSYLYALVQEGRKLIKIDESNTLETIEFAPNTASTLAIGANQKLYVGLGEESDSPNILVFDISDTKLFALPNLITPSPTSDPHSRIVGISHNRNTLFTAEGSKRRLDPFVTQWDISSDTPVVVSVEKYFGYDLIHPGKIVFSLDDRFVFVLSDGTASSQNKHKVYQLENADSPLVEIASYNTDYLPIAMAFAHPTEKSPVVSQLVIARDATPARWSPSSKRNLAVREFYVAEFDSTGVRDIVRETGIVINTGEQMISRNQLVVSKNNTVFMLLGLEKSTAIAAVRSVY